MKIETFDDWYKVKGDDFIEKGGAKLLIHYGNSLYKMLVSVFPEHSWIPWRYASTFRKVIQYFAGFQKFLKGIGKISTISAIFLRALLKRLMYNHPLSGQILGLSIFTPRVHQDCFTNTEDS